jgi:hypothetical protein
MKNKTYIVDWIHPFQTAKIGSVISGVAGALLGLVGYVTYALVMYSASQTSGGAQATEQLPSPQEFQIGGFVLLFFMYLVAGFFIGYVGAFIYNMVAPKLGGIEVKLKEKNSAS